MSDDGEDNKRRGVDISDYIDTVDDGRVSNDYLYKGSSSHLPNQQQKDNQVWTRPFGYGAAARRPDGLRLLMNRQNIDSRILRAARSNRITSHEEAIREASLMRTASTIATVQILNGEEAVALRDPYDHLSKLRFENAYRSDPVVRRCVDVLAKFVVGRRTHYHITTYREEGEDAAMVAHGYKPPPASTGHLPSDLTPPSLPGIPSPPGHANASSSSRSPVRTAADGVFTSDNVGDGAGNVMPPSTPTGGEEDEMAHSGGSAGEMGSRDYDISEQELREMHRLLADISKKVKFHERVKAALTQTYVYGRAALLMETDQQGLPSELKLLNPKKLETVYVDPNTWKMMAVDYADRPKEEPLLAEEMIYFANQDFHISPDTLYYGLSKVEPVVHTSETNQLLDEIDLKEGARSMWAGSGVIKFPPDTADELVEEFVENFYPGTWNATSQNVQLDVYNLRMDYISLVHAREQNDRRIIRGLGVPQFLVGFENISNRATAEEVMISWHESELDAERVWLRDVLEPQYFDYIINLRFPDLHRTHSCRVVMDFDNISFETLREKSEAIIPLFDRGLATPEKVLETLRWQDQTDVVLAELERRTIEKERKFQLELAIRKQRAQSYVLAQTQEKVEQKRAEKKEEQGLTAQAALVEKMQQQQALNNQQQNSTTTVNELHLLQMQLMKEAHARDMEVKDAQLKTASHKKKMLEKMSETLEKLQAEGGGGGN